jgi:uncharacterized protein
MAPAGTAPFLRYSTWLRERYGGTTYRVSVDAGFGCPVRDLGRPCAYCDARGSRAPYLGEHETIADQVRRGVEFLSRRYGAERFLLYFQAYSNTHASVPRLREIYDWGLAQGEFAGLVVATRPDCIDEARADLLGEYAARGLDVWVELGLQSANDRTLEDIGRGHTVARFDEAVRVLAARGVHVAAHAILGLPGEGPEEAIATVRHVSSLPVEGVKFHNLVVLEGTELWERYRAGRIDPPSAQEHERLLVAAIEHLREDIVVMRLTCDPPRGVRHAPEAIPDKGGLYRRLLAGFAERGTRQGIYWSDHADEG